MLATRYMNYYIGTLSGMLLAMVTVAAHNFFHQKDSFRMYYFDLSLMSSRFVNKIKTRLQPSTCKVNYLSQLFFTISHNRAKYIFNGICREWRISHALSHHLYTNTIIDLEIQMFEPIMQFLPVKKSFITRYVSWIYCPLFYMSVFAISFLRR